MGEQSEFLQTEKSLDKKVQIDAGWWTVQRNGGRAPTKSATINYYLHFKEEEIEKWTDLPQIPGM